MRTDAAFGNTDQEVGTTRCHCPVVNSRMKNTTPLASHSMSVPRCHHRASPIEWRRPGRPRCLGRVTESCLAVQFGSSGTGRWNRNQSLPGVLCLVQYSRGWSARIWIPERMMNTISSRLRKWVTSTHTGRPGCARALAGTVVPG
jgi:hypothetical protein